MEILTFTELFLHDTPMTFHKDASIKTAFALRRTSNADVSTIGETLVHPKTKEYSSMKVTFVGHASILVEAGGVTVLSDPWWRGPCFGAQWWNYPFAYLTPLKSLKIDYIYISHGHHDHLHPGTLSTLDKNAKILVAAGTGLAQSIQALGFEVIEVNNSQAVSLGKAGLKCRIMETRGDDTLMTLDDGTEVCLNLNDALHSAPTDIQNNFVNRLKSLYPKIDYVFCGYGTASHFPNCYVIPGKDRNETAARRQRYFNRQWARLIFKINPKFGFPFAADVVLLEEDLIWANEPIQNSERPTTAFASTYPSAKPICLDIAPGFVIDSGRVVYEILRKPFIEVELRAQCKEMIERTNRYGTVEAGALNELAKLLESAIAASKTYLRSYKGNYRFLLYFKNSTAGIAIEKKGQDIRLIRLEDCGKYEYDVKYTTRAPYMKLALTQPFGDEILFVGSGGIFEYARHANIAENPHRELMEIIRRRGAADLPRYESRVTLISGAKKMVKRMFGRRDEDLYDLNEWTARERTY